MIGSQMEQRSITVKEPILVGLRSDNIKRFTITQTSPTALVPARPLR